jgi:ABC-type bacteriocin/lantibiotic exporter with double-glycine peptidase domain
MLLIAPFWKQLFCKLDYSKLGDRWNNGVCLQTSGTSCVPACCATVVSLLGGRITERELAMEAGTTSRGTEIWYMMRAMPGHGYKIEPHVAKSVKDIPAPSILGLKAGGHVIVLMSKSDAGPDIGNPLGQRRQYTWSAFEKAYDIEPIYFIIRPIRDQK